MQNPCHTNENVKAKATLTFQPILRSDAKQRYSHTVETRASQRQ